MQDFIPEHLTADNIRELAAKALATGPIILDVLCFSDPADEMRFEDVIDKLGFQDVLDAVRLP